ncbi:hypothetical protein BSK66_28405 [Paenibacillus odorifer]|uniref:hypothetical protein n=1 Tax=Paenibacillus TaxID=44249 RepID=UPI0003E1FA95|nr:MULTISPECIES: hypothetical protein [Paenibacillus]ETT46568.1 hypothetical protein C171_28202 [Paenibacillus sp. FSL H8-237]OME48635.1 hypothetical protein BSK66_28405 [Paenibacillus odorifer]
MSIAFNRKVVPVNKIKEEKKLIVTMRFVDDEGNVVFNSMEEAFTQLSQPERNKLLARIKWATTGKKHRAL